MEDVVSFKLQNGQELIGRARETEDEYIVEEARILHPHVTQEGMQLVPVPVFFANNDLPELKLPKSSVALGPIPVSSEVERVYIQVTTNIVLGGEKL